MSTPCYNGYMNKSSAFSRKVLNPQTPMQSVKKALDKSTSWGKVANWYNNFIEKTEDSYQRTLILPNLIRLLEIKRGEAILDLACGQGFFAREFAKLGAKVIGVDIAPELIAIAKQDRSSTFSLRDNNLTKQVAEFKKMLDRSVEYHVSQAHKLDFLHNQSVDKITIILSLQNVENANEVIKEVSRVLRPKGKLFIVLNHPAFRIPKQSSWGWDETKKVQYRRLDSYLSEAKETIQMHPGDNPSEKTISFHRPLQFYFKLLSKNGFLISRLEEWNSHRISEEGPKKEAEDRARREFPLFLYLEAINPAPFFCGVFNPHAEKETTKPTHQAAGF